MQNSHEKPLYAEICNVCKKQLIKNLDLPEKRQKTVIGREIETKRIMWRVCEHKKVEILAKLESYGQDFSISVEIKLKA